MKNKILILFAISAMFGAVSCEDMLSTDSKVVVFEKDNTLSHPTDSVYSLLGVIQKIQVIVDRTHLLGELRGDLVSTTMYATTDLKKLNSFDFSSENVYNEVSDYYAVINNCNYFLAHADTSFTVGGKQIFKKEYYAILSYRAWTYLQLAQAYGRVPYVEEPITSGDMADISKYPLLDIREIAKRLIPSLENCLGENNNTDFPSIGQLGSAKIDSKKLYIPVRLILGDLYLWAGGKENAGKAAVCYHDYLVSNQRRINTGTYNVYWQSKDYFGNSSYAYDYYSRLFSNGENGRDNNQICFIPMESSEYKGVVSDLNNIFNSTEDNDYYNQVTYSKALLKLSSDQIYTHFYHRNTYNTPDSRDTLYIIDKSVISGASDDFDKNEINSALYKGDLRLSQVITTSKLVSDFVNWNDQIQTISKIKSDRVCLYRNDVVYLRFAEALNRAGLPEMAFAILKYGLCEETITDRISAAEIARANSISLSLLSFPTAYFGLAKLVYDTGKADYYSSEDDAVSTLSNTFGLHSRGSGDASTNKYYVIPSTCTNLNDSIEAVEEMILDEMALETCFEGYRFGDLLRISMHRVESESGAFADNKFLADKLALRDQTLYSKLIGTGNNYNEKLFLPLPR